MPTLKPAEILPVICEAATEAGKIALTHFRSDIITQNKINHHDIVTQADTQCQEIIVGNITRGMNMLGIETSEIGFIGEEKNLMKPGKYQFVIDPIDGTSNYASGFEYFAISVACFVDGVLTAGTVYKPSSGELFSAATGCGSTQVIGNNQETLSCRAQDMRDILVVAGLNNNDQIRSRMLKLIGDIYPAVRSVRVTGSSALDVAYVSMNSFGAVIQSACMWDIAAAHIIVREAGGDLFDWNGTPLTYDLQNPAMKFRFIATHPNMLSLLLPFLKS